MCGRKPAPVDRWFIPLIIGFQPSKVVQDFFHPQYVMSLTEGEFGLVQYCLASWGVIHAGVLENWHEIPDDVPVLEWRLNCQVRLLATEIEAYVSSIWGCELSDL